MRRKNSVNHPPPGTIAPLIGGIIPSPNIGNIFLNSRSGINKMIKIKSGTIKIGKNNSAALPNTSNPPLYGYGTEEYHRCHDDANWGLD